MKSPESRVDFCPRFNQRQHRRIGKKRSPRRGHGLGRESTGDRSFDKSISYFLVRLSRQGLVGLRCSGPASLGTLFCGSPNGSMIVHLIDGTYELFRHFYGLRRFTKGEDRPFGAVVGVIHTVLQMIETGATHVGVATDHIIESFRNRSWSGYKTGDGIDPVLLAQFHPLEESLAAMGIAVWPMIELEADDALASAARIASENTDVQQICIWTPD